MTIDSTRQIPSKYQCIYCSTPCDSLYRVYGSSTTTIKLSRCSHCQRDVDPYCERELVLVGLDCLLFREEAYRHLLFHRYVNLQFNTFEAKTLLILTTSVVRACVISISQHHGRSVSVFKGDIPFYFVQQTILSGAIYFLHTWVIAVCLFFAVTNVSRVHIPSRVSEQWFTQVYLSILLPMTACHGATIFFRIWEQSDTIDWMGSCLILAYQWFALNTVVRGTMGVASNVQTTLIVTIVFVVSLMIRNVSLEVARHLLMNGDETFSTVCPGLELKMGRWGLSFLLKTMDSFYLCLS